MVGMKGPALRTHNYATSTVVPESVANDEASKQGFGPPDFTSPDFVSKGVADDASGEDEAGFQELELSASGGKKKKRTGKHKLRVGASTAPSPFWRLPVDHCSPASHIGLFVQRESVATLGKLQRIERLKEMKEGGVEAELRMTAGNSTVRVRQLVRDEQCG